MPTNNLYLDIIESMVDDPNVTTPKDIERDWEGGCAAYPFLQRMIRNPEQTPALTRQMVSAWDFFDTNDAQRDVILTCLPMFDQDVLLSLILEGVYPALRRPALIEFVADHLSAHALGKIDDVYKNEWAPSFPDMNPQNSQRFGAIQHLVLSFIDTDPRAQKILNTYPLAASVIKRIEKHRMQNAVVYVIQSLNTDWYWRETNQAAVHCLIALGEHQALLDAIKENRLDEDAKTQTVQRLAEVLEDVSALEPYLDGSSSGHLLLALARRADASALDLIEKAVQNPPPSSESDAANHAYTAALAALITHLRSVALTLIWRCLMLHRGYRFNFWLMPESAANLLIVALHGSATEGILLAQMTVRQQNRLATKPYDSGLTLDQLALDTASQDAVEAFLIEIARQMLRLIVADKEQALALADLLATRPHPVLLEILAPYAASVHGKRGKIGELIEACRQAAPWPVG